MATTNHPAWRLIIDGPLDGPSNMAIDEALFEGVQAGGRPILRLYRWRPACLSFGRNQRAGSVYDAALAHASGIDIVRRPTGGLAVYHDRELTYAVIVANGRLGGPRATYAAINRALAAALVDLGVPATMHEEQERADRTRDTPAEPLSWPTDSTAGPAMRLAPNPCFHSPAAGEIMAGGRKLIGSAQRCEKRTILQHGSILISGDQSAAARLQHGATSVPDSAGILDFLDSEPDPARLNDAVVRGFEAVYGIRFEACTASVRELDRSRELEHRYRSAAWTWRR